MAKLRVAVKRLLPMLPVLLVFVVLLGPFSCQRSELLGTVSADGGAFTPPRFSPPVLVAALSDSNAIDEDPTLTGDLRELFFMSTRDGDRDIWTSRRDTADAAWGPPVRVAELDSPASDWAPSVSLDGLRIWFASDRDDVGRGQLWRATRASRAAAWDPPTPVAELASGSVDFAPAVDATETTLLMSSDRINPAAAGGGADFDIYVATRATTGAAWDWPAPVPGINSGSDEYDPFVAQAGLVVFFTSMRSGMGDIYWSSRSSLSASFAPPVELEDLNSPEYDSDATLSPDLGTMMFSSTRSGNAEIYETHAIQ
jgi:hypothetical protein